MTRRVTCTVALLISAASVFAQNETPDVTTQKLADNVYMLQGNGGNIGLLVGKDGPVMVDDQYAPMSDKIKAAVAKLTDQPVKFLINTHWHGDHTGGNENFGKAGAIIVAHDNVRKRMNTEQFMEAFGRTVEASPPIALPIVTFSDTTTLYWNDEEIRVIHVDPAHTDGDSIIYFTKANVLHTGDCFFNGMYPFIDPSSGGSIDGMIAASERILELVNDETKIIPGHGPAGSAEDVREFRNMLQTARDNIQKLIDVGKTKDETIAAKPTAELDAKWGNGYFKPDMWVGIVYLGMKKD